jgi:hypothetical protein
LLIDQLTKAIGLFFVFLLNLVKKRLSESYGFRPSLGEGLSLGME